MNVISMPGQQTFRKIAAIFFASRLWIAFWVYQGHSGHPFLEPIPGGWQGVSSWWLNPWTTYDSEWYLQIAQQGYTIKTAVFFPLYPLLLKLLPFSINTMALSGMVISNLSFALALWVIYRLAEKDFGAKAAWFAVFILAFFPSSVFFSAVYTEALFLLLFSSAYLMMRKEKWAYAVLLGFLAGLTRVTGCFIFLAFLTDYLIDLKKGKDKLNPARILAICTPLFAFFLFKGYTALTMNTFFWGHLSLGNRGLTVPWIPLWKDFLYLIHLLPEADITHRNVWFYTFTEWGAALSAAGCLLLFWKKAPKGYLVYLGILLLTCLSAPTEYNPFTTGVSRFFAPAFPLMLLIGATLSRLKNERFVFYAFIFLLTASAFFAFQFGLKSFVG